MKTFLFSNKKYGKSILLIVTIFLCCSCFYRGVQGEIKEFEFHDIDVKYYYYCKPQEGRKLVSWADYDTPYTTNFERFGNYINDANFFNFLSISFSANDYKKDVDNRSVTVQYSIYDDSFMPFNAQILFKKGSTLSDGSIAEKDIYDRYGEIYTPEVSNWIDDQINIDFGNFKGYSPVYLKLGVLASWSVANRPSNIVESRYDTWTSEFIAFFKLR